MALVSRLRRDNAARAESHLDGEGRPAGRRDAQEGCGSGLKGITVWPETWLSIICEYRQDSEMWYVWRQTSLKALLYLWLLSFGRLRRVI